MTRTHKRTYKKRNDTQRHSHKKKRNNVAHSAKFYGLGLGDLDTIRHKQFVEPYVSLNKLIDADVALNTPEPNILIDELAMTWNKNLPAIREDIYLHFTTDDFAKIKENKGADIIIGNRRVGLGDKHFQDVMRRTDGPRAFYNSLTRMAEDKIRDLKNTSIGKAVITTNNIVANVKHTENTIKKDIKKVNNTVHTVSAIGNFLKRF